MTDQQLREAIAAEWGVWSPAEAARRAGSRGHSPTTAVRRWAAAGRIFAVPVAGSDHYPGFCFDPSGRPHPLVGPVVATLPAGLRGWDLARWWTSPLVSLGGRRPVDALDDPDGLLAAARLTDPPA